MSGTDRWMAWYVDDEIPPTAVKAPDRATASTIGERARDEPVTAVIAETEGAARDLEGIPEGNLSTEDDPGRFVRYLDNGGDHGDD